MRGNTYYFLQQFQRYIPARVLNYVISTSNTSTIFDVGCSAGDFYAYIRHHRRFKDLIYTGFDISSDAIQRARKVYGPHFLTVKDVNDITAKADIVFSCDVVPHLLKPYEHIQKLIDLSNRFVIITLRTTKKQSTYINRESYGEQVPYVVLNYSSVSNVVKGSLWFGERCGDHDKVTILIDKKRRLPFPCINHVKEKKSNSQLAWKIGRLLEPFKKFMRVKSIKRIGDI